MFFSTHFFKHSTWNICLLLQFSSQMGKFGSSWKSQKQIEHVASLPSFVSSNFLVLESIKACVRFITGEFLILRMASYLCYRLLNMAIGNKKQINTHVKISMTTGMTLTHTMAWKSVLYKGESFDNRRIYSLLRYS